MGTSKHTRIMFAARTIATRTTTTTSSSSSSKRIATRTIITSTAKRSSFLRKSFSFFFLCSAFPSSVKSSSVSEFSIMGDSEYPGTADGRLETCKNRAKSLTSNELSQDWEAIVRPKLLWAAGLRDLTNVAPGKGNTGHCFNDFNHVDATTMLMQTADNERRVGERHSGWESTGRGDSSGEFTRRRARRDVVHVFARRQSRTSARRRARAIPV